MLVTCSCVKLVTIEWLGLNLCWAYSVLSLGKALLLLFPSGLGEYLGYMYIHKKVLSVFLQKGERN